MLITTCLKIAFLNFPSKNKILFDDSCYPKDEGRNKASRSILVAAANSAMGSLQFYVSQTAAICFPHKPTVNRKEEEEHYNHSHNQAL